MHVVIDCIEVMSGYRLTRVPHYPVDRLREASSTLAVEQLKLAICEISQSQNYEVEFFFPSSLATPLLFSSRR